MGNQFFNASKSKWRMLPVVQMLYDLCSDSAPITHRTNSYLLCISWQFSQINLGVISFVDAYLQSENKWNYGTMEFMLIMGI